MDHELDVSDLPAPEPFEQALDALRALAPGDRLLLRHRRQPYPLYELLARIGYDYQVEGRDGDWLIRIQAPSAAAGETESSRAR